MDTNRFLSVAALSAAALVVTSAEAAASDYAKKMTIGVNASRASGLARVEGLPVPVRLSAGITGFSYNDVTATGVNKDLLFTDVDGNSLPYEIESWDTEGESIVWVRLPAYAAGEKIFLYYGGAVVAQNAAAVWAGYTGVWHMSESSGSVADATGNGLTAESMGSESQQSIATPGPVGSARINATSDTGNYLSVASDEKLNFGGKLTFSGWFKTSATHGGGRMTLISRKKKLWEEGWNVSILPDSSTGIGYWGQYNNDWGRLAALDVPDFKQNWLHVTVTWNGNTGYMYINGQRWSTVRQSDWTSNTWLQQATDPDNSLSFGYTSEGTWDDGWSRPLQGAYDEYRLAGTVQDADRIAAEYASQAYADALDYEVDASVSGQVAFGALPDATSATGDGKVTLTVLPNIISLTGAEAGISLLVGVAEQKDGEGMPELRKVANGTVTATGSASLAWSGAVLGAKIYYQVINELASEGGAVLTNATEIKSIILEDGSTYKWKANNKGLWSDAGNWTREGEDDGLPRLGYPSWGSNWIVLGNQVDEIQVDAAYEGFTGSPILGWGGADITFTGVVENASIDCHNSGFRDGQYGNVQVTLDNVAFKAVGNYHIYPNASLTMRNGAYLYTRWEFLVQGENARLDVGDRCEIYQDGVDGDRFVFVGENAEISISNAVVRARVFKIGGNSSSDAGEFGGAKPKGIFFSGEGPQLKINQYAKQYTDPGADIPVVFSIPTNGFARTPIVKEGSTSRSFLEQDASVTHQFAFSIDPKSPVYTTIRGRMSQAIVAWQTSSASYAINTAAITLVKPRYAEGEGWRYGPADAETKSTLTVDLRRPGFLLYVR